MTAQLPYNSTLGTTRLLPLSILHKTVHHVRSTPLIFLAAPATLVALTYAHTVLSAYYWTHRLRGQKPRLEAQLTRVRKRRRRAEREVREMIVWQEELEVGLLEGGGVRVEECEEWREGWAGVGEQLGRVRELREREGELERLIEMVERLL
jgi:hypothetical protein